jgi:hypothetical protein
MDLKTLAQKFSDAYEMLVQKNKFGFCNLSSIRVLYFPFVPEL